MSVRCWRRHRLRSAHSKRHQRCSRRSPFARSAPPEDRGTRRGSMRARQAGFRRLDEFADSGRVDEPKSRRRRGAALSSAALGAGRPQVAAQVAQDFLQCRHNRVAEPVNRSRPGPTNGGRPPQDTEITGAACQRTRTSLTTSAKRLRRRFFRLVTLSRCKMQLRGVDAARGDQ
jgi:hypothetical protein